MKRKRMFWVAIPVILLLAIGAAFYYYRFLVPPVLVRGEFETAVAEYGPVIRTVDAEGIVEAENEVLLRSPASTVIKRIYHEPGSYVNAGEIILILDSEQIEEQIENITDQLKVKRNNLRKNRLNAHAVKVDLEYNVEMKELRIASIKSELNDQKQLLEVGGISPARIEKTKQELEAARKDLEMILQKNSIRLKQLEAEEEGLLLQIEIQEKELAAKREILQKMVVRAPSSGMVLNIYGNEGEKTNVGQLLVIMSDMTSFKINGAIDEKQADLITTGRQVYAVIDREWLPGQIGNIKPMIEDNKVRFDVFLENSSHEKLIPNLRVDLRVVQARRDSTLRVPNGPALTANKKQEVFVVGSGKARRREVVTGLKGADWMEILEGLEAGEEIIISDISSYRRMKEIEIENP